MQQTRESKGLFPNYAIIGATKGKPLPVAPSIKEVKASPIKKTLNRQDRN